MRRIKKGRLKHICLYLSNKYGNCRHHLYGIKYTGRNKYRERKNVAMDINQLENGHKIMGKLGHDAGESEPKWSYEGEIELYIQKHKGKIVLITCLNTDWAEYGVNDFHEPSSTFETEGYYMKVVKWNVNTKRKPSEIKLDIKECKTRLKKHSKRRELYRKKAGRFRKRIKGSKSDRSHVVL